MYGFWLALLLRSLLCASRVVQILGKESDKSFVYSCHDQLCSGSFVMLSFCSENKASDVASDWSLVSWQNVSRQNLTRFLLLSEKLMWNVVVSELLVPFSSILKRKDAKLSQELRCNLCRTHLWQRVELGCWCQVPEQTMVRTEEVNLKGEVLVLRMHWKSRNVIVYFLEV